MGIEWGACASNYVGLFSRLDGVQGPQVNFAKNIHSPESEIQWKCEEARKDKTQVPPLVAHRGERLSVGMTTFFKEPTLSVDIWKFPIIS